MGKLNLEYHFYVKVLKKAIIQNDGNSL